MGAANVRLRCTNLLSVLAAFAKKRPATDVVLHEDTSGIAVGHVAIYKNSVLEQRDDYKSTCIMMNAAQAEKFGHTIVVRESHTPLTKDMGLSPEWAKIALLYDYLVLGYKYVLALDLDAVMATPLTDVLSSLAGELAASSKDVLFSDCQGLSIEGWGCLSHGCINTGVLMAKNTRWAKRFLRQLLAMAAPNATCGYYANRWGFENSCISKLCNLSPSEFQTHVHIVSGDRYNRASSSMLSYLYNCTLVPFYAQTGFTFSKCKDLHDKFVYDQDMYIFHMYPSAMGSYTLLFNLFASIYMRYDSWIGAKWFGRVSVAHDHRREKNKHYMLANGADHTTSDVFRRWVTHEI